MSLVDVKILVVDDNPINIKLIGRMLTSSNFKMISASSGEEALQLARLEKPDLILLDVLMPGMDGYQTCAKLKNSGETKFIPVIFLSAKNETIDKAKGLSLGAVDYLTKPFDQVEIIARIRSHLSVFKDVIELQRKNESLLYELEKLKKSGNSSWQDGDLYYLDALKNFNYREANKYLQAAARVKFCAPLVTTLFMPVLVDQQNFLFLLSGGFKKDHKTSFGQLLLQKYVTGFFQGLDERSFTEKALYAIFDKILENFSPDVYDTAFTLGLCHLNATKGEFIHIAVHQSLPVFLNDKNALLNVDSLPVFYESKYAKIINASKIKVPPKSTLFQYLSGKELTHAEEMEKYILPVFKNGQTDIAANVEFVFNGLPEKADDQLVLGIKLL